MIHIYESKTAPEARRFIAQAAGDKSCIYLTFQGATADAAIAKANLIMEYQRVPPLDRKAFDLKGRLAALGCEPAEVEDLL